MLWLVLVPSWGTDGRTIDGRGKDVVPHFPISECFKEHSILTYKMLIDETIIQQFNQIYKVTKSIQRLNHVNSVTNPKYNNLFSNSNYQIY